MFVGLVGGFAIAVILIRLRTQFDIVFSDALNEKFIGLLAGICIYLISASLIRSISGQSIADKITKIYFVPRFNSVFFKIPVSLLFFAGLISILWVYALELMLTRRQHEFQLQLKFFRFYETFITLKVKYVEYPEHYRITDHDCYSYMVICRR